MSKVYVSKVVDGQKLEATVDYDFEKVWDEASEELRKSPFRAAVTVTLQNTLRRHLAKGESQEQLQAIADQHKPGMVSRTRGKTKVEKVRDLYAGMSEDEKAEMKKQLREMLTAERASKQE
jgi:hypothetical protein